MRKKVAAHLEVNHCYAQKVLVDWKYKHLQNLVRTPPKARKGNGNRIAYRFATLSLSELVPYHTLFYQTGKKRIPKEYFLSPLSLAVWFMDDGCKSRNSVYLNTQQFDLFQQQLLIEQLKLFKVESTVNRDKQYYRLRVRVQSIPQFRKLVHPFLLPEFEYKLP